MTEPRPEYVQSLARGIEVVRALDADNPRLTLSDVAKRTGLTRATARRFLLTLTELGYVRADGPLFALTPKMLELGYSYLSSLTLPEVAGPHLDALTKRVNESASVSILDGAEIVYIARVPVSRIMTVSITIGTRFPAYATSMGRVLLAGLPERELTDYLANVELAPRTDRTIATKKALREELSRVRRTGYCVVYQELEAGLRALAAPIRDHTKAVVAAANISMPAARYTAAEVRNKLLPALLNTVEAIHLDLARIDSHRHRSGLR
jgi:IclR family pca regulon transcriptional regulator